MKRTIVTSHWKEDLTWLKNSGHDVVLIDKEGADPTCIQAESTVPNVCGETPVYLKYIIDNYENLPNVVAFVHGHEFAYHHKHPLHILDLIENLEVSGYISLNGTWRTIPNIDDPNHSLIKLRKYWHLIEPVVGPYPHSYGIACANSQFLVTCERIRRIPLVFYKYWYDQVLKDTSVYIQTFFEYTWHVIFGEPWVMQLQAFLPLKKGLLRPRPIVIQEMHIP